jgi:hypothetical protein
MRESIFVAYTLSRVTHFNMYLASVFPLLCQWNLFNKIYDILVNFSLKNLVIVYMKKDKIISSLVLDIKLVKTRGNMITLFIQS